MSENEVVIEKKKRRKAASPDPKRDVERLGHYSTQLLLAAGEAVTPETMAAVIRSAPRSEDDAHSPCACGLAAGLLIIAEGKGADGRFLPVADFILEEMPNWGRMRRAAAEDALALALGE
jgi:hypothetical protein